MNKVACRICILLMLLFVSTGFVLLSSTTSALSNKQYSMYAQNDIMFYDPNGGSIHCWWEPGAGDNKDYAGNQIWSDEDLEKIKNYQSTYEEAAKKYNVPWQMLAVIHKIETNLTDTNPPDDGKNLTWQGLYGLYDYAITKNGKVTDAPLFDPGRKLSPEEFLKQSEIAAKTLADYGYDLSTEGGIKRTFFHWNGAAQEYIDKALRMKTKNFTQEDAENGEGSYYVMNRYDAERDPTNKEKMDPEWPGMFVKAHVYDPAATTERYGVYVLYQALTGEGGGREVCDDDPSRGGGGGCADNWRDGEVINYFQCNESWSDERLSSCQNMCDGGCGPTSLASLISMMTKEKVTPSDIRQILVDDYPQHIATCPGQGTGHTMSSVVVPKYGLASETLTLTSSQVSEKLKSGSAFHVTGEGYNNFWNTDGHFVAIYDITKDGEWKVLDSGSKQHPTHTKSWEPDEIWPGVEKHAGGQIVEITCGG